MFGIDKFHEILFFESVFNIWTFSVCHHNLQIFWPFKSIQKLAALYFEVGFKSIIYSSIWSNHLRPPPPPPPSRPSSMATRTGRKIKHALNGGEQTMDGVYVDGYDPVKNLILEFHGCLFHGCLQRFPELQLKYPFSCLTMESLYRTTKKKIKKLKKKHQVVQMWENQYDKVYREDKQFQSLTDSLYSHRDPLRPRDRGRCLVGWSH